jgi:hypothetical protein
MRVLREVDDGEAMPVDPLETEYGDVGGGDTPE